MNQRFFLLVICPCPANTFCPENVVCLLHLQHISNTPEHFYHGSEQYEPRL